jgi:hypothetical protein
VSKLPDPAEHRRQFGTLTASDRRNVVRAVNRGAAVEKRKHAPLAVVIAQRQMRLWRYAWILGGAVGLVAARDGWRAVAVNAVIGMLMFALVGRYWYTRARRSEQANLALMQGKGRGKPTTRRPGATGSAGTTRTGDDVSAAGRWLPRRRSRE